jgi:hypothetical protein
MNCRPTSSRLPVSWVCAWIWIRSAWMASSLRRSLAAGLLGSPTSSRYWSSRASSSRRRALSRFLRTRYNLYSGFAHGELYALWQSFEEVPTTDGQRLHRPAARIEPFWGAAATSIWALHAAELRAIVLFGPDPTGAKDWLDDRDELLKPLD